MALHSLQTSRLRIRRFTAGDLDAVAHVLDNCFGQEPRTARAQWLDWTVRNYSALEQLRQPPYGDYAIELNATGQVIGAVGLVPSFGPFDTLPSLRSTSSANPNLFRPELGLFWAVETAHRRAGYATEAGKAMIEFAFKELHSRQIVATTEHDNVASIAIMRRLGMTIDRNPEAEPHWFQTVGVLANPSLVRVGQTKL